MVDSLATLIAAIIVLSSNGSAIDCTEDYSMCWRIDDPQHTTIVLDNAWIERYDWSTGQPVERAEYVRNPYCGRKGNVHHISRYSCLFRIAFGLRIFDGDTLGYAYQRLFNGMMAGIYPSVSLPHCDDSDRPPLAPCEV